jgi:hypothetical protein
VDQVQPKKVFGTVRKAMIDSPPVSEIPGVQRGVQCRDL